MSEQRFLTGSREQSFLLPPDMHDWLPMGRGGRPNSQDEQTSLRGLLPAGGLESHSRWSVAHEPDQFDSLAIGQASDRLRRRDPALAEPTRRPHRADLR